MTATPQSRQSIQYPTRTVTRAERAMRCAPFQLHLFSVMVEQSVSLKEIAHKAGVENRYTSQPLSELRAESELLWLIQVGLLRREVDGQGLTDSFRVTPLGRQLVNKWQNYQALEEYSPGWIDHCYNLSNRWLRLPI